ncbi:MAG: type II toxin-antitoxin system RelE/ParE family toxin [Peptoniphilus sp.]|nr:type II toxin-antitoxin system RelE/ParE family toxin [Peptoniphilus harei]
MTICLIHHIIFDKRIVLTNGFVKKSNKTPRSEIELAIKYKKDFERRFL